MSELWRFHLLGDWRAVQGERVVTRFRTAKTGGLLAYLVFYRDRLHARDTLLDLFWPDSDLAAARNSLSVALNSLRQQFEPDRTPGTSPTGEFLIADRSTVRLRADAFSSDVADFEAAALPLLSTTSVAPTDALLAAEQLYQGELLPGYFEDWVVAERERMAATYLQIVHALVRSFLESGARDRAAEYLQRAMRIDTLDEETLRLAALLPKRASELSPATKDHADHAVASVPPLPPSSAREPHAARGHLPMPLTRFFGRESELEGIEAALGPQGRTRLVTLTGTGGAGKTRLSIESATRLRQSLPGGTYFVALADLPTPLHIGNALRDALGLPRSASAEPLTQVIAALAQRPPCLLVLDNLEHLLGRGPLDSGGAAAVVRALLSETPNVRLLVTSRQLLGLPGEQELPVAPLPLPPAPDYPVAELLRYPAVQLFVNRAQTRRVDFRLTPQNRATVAQVCARLEGIPLALELAASWAKLFTPAQILERLNEGFAFLETRRPDVPARHRSLWAAAAWSYGMLAPEVQQVFARLSVFRGGCTTDAASMVCSDGTDAATNPVLEHLTRLYDTSLLIMEDARAGQEQQIRLRLLEPLRDFADDRLTPAERTAVQQRHAEYFLSFVEEAEQHLTGPEQQKWFDFVEADLDNVRTVLLRHTKDEIGLRVAGALGRFWTIRGYFREGANWLEQVLQASAGDAASPWRAKALNSAGTVAYHRADFATARSYFEASLRTWETFGNLSAAIKTVLNLGNVAYRQGDTAEARAHYEEALRQYRAHGDDWGIASALGSLGNIAQSTGDYAASRAFQEESLARSRAIGDARMTAYTLHNLGNLAVLQRDTERAHELYAKSLTGTRALGDRRGVAALLLSLAFLALESGNFGTARHRLAEAIPLAREVEDRLGMLLALDGAAWYAQSAGSGYERAVQLWAASEAGRTALNVPRSVEDRPQFAGLLEAARQQTASERFAVLWAEGEALTLEAAVALAYAEVTPDTTSM